MAQFFIKRLGSQEMGSPTKNSDGSFTFHRGRYLLVSKEFLNFFPYLSKTVLNDSTALPLIPPHLNEIVYAQYVYHNSKHVDTAYVDGQGRDEFRIYLNSQIDDNKRLFAPNDLVVFMKCQDGDVNYYALKVIPPTSSDYSFWLDKLTNGNYGFWEGEPHSPFAINYQIPKTSATILEDKRVVEAVENQQAQVIDEIDKNDPSKIMGADLFNSRTFHDFVMMAYGEMCAITKRVISCNGFNNLEAAHIMPQAHKGSFLPCNGIAMSRDMHCVFDKGFFTIEDDYTIIVHPDVLATYSYLNEYNGHHIIVPQVEYFRPLPRFLKHHRDNVYGTFRQIRSNWITKN